MNFSKIVLSQLTAIGTVALLAQPAAAMTCADFQALDEEGQMQAVNDMANEAGAAVREDTPLEEDASSDGTVQVETDEVTNVDAPRGDEFTETVTVIREECENDPNYDMKTVNFEAPKEK
ncbi:hypothetical protein [uncultured Roseovarius sp.]|uniref:hypothetical protein n=1 Tax=uncultured Roseovarius sp. TaxID=293344 RepID=UPI002630F83E|nr:hypothetical protein [uncultured Roseovarius sp.]